MVLVVHHSIVAISEDREDLKNWKEIARKRIERVQKEIQEIEQIEMNEDEAAWSIVLDEARKGMSLIERSTFEPLGRFEQKDYFLRNKQEILTQEKENLSKAEQSESLRKKLYCRYQGKPFGEHIKERIFGKDRALDFFLKNFTLIILIGLAFIYGGRVTYHSVRWARKKN